MFLTLGEKKNILDNIYINIREMKNKCIFLYNEFFLKPKKGKREKQKKF